MKTIQDILSGAGFPCEGDNRNKAIKGCNALLNAGAEISVADKGRTFFRQSNGYEFKIKINFVGFTGRYKSVNNYIEPYDVLKAASLFLKTEGVRANLKTLHATTPNTCGKCNGKGIIPAFMYYANGVCFDCMGLGVRGNFSITETAKP